MDSNPIIDYLQAAFGEELDGGWVGDTLLLEDAGSQGISIVVLSYFTGSLDDDRPLVVLVINEMHSAAGDLAASS